MGRKHGFSFSWKRAVGISAAKGRISRKVGVPLTRSGRQRKVGRAVGCCVPLSLGLALLAGCATLKGSEPGPSLPGDLGELAAEVRPPARFADHRPDFRVEDLTVTYHWWRDGRLSEREQTMRLVLDGDRPVMFIGGKFFAPYPGHDTRRWIDDTFNPMFFRFGVDTPMGSPGLQRNPTVEIVGMGQRLEYTMTGGDVEGAGPGDRTRFVLEVDPVFGYVLTRHTVWRAPERPVNRRGEPMGSFRSGMWYTGGITSVWPDEIGHAYSGVAWGRRDERSGGRPQDGRPAGDDAPPFVVWSNNSESMYRRFHPVVAPGGFVANLRDRTGWGVALTYEADRPQQHSVCPIWGGFHMHRPLEAVQTEDGHWTGEFVQRIVTLPPEIVDHIIDHARQVNDRGHVILIRPDGEDFEDQPLPAGTVERGFQPDRTHGIDTGQNCRISDRHARSGSKSLEVDGMTAEAFVGFRFFPRDRAHTRFLPGKRYRMECWVKVEGEDTQAFLIPTPALGLSPERLVEGEGVGTHRTETVRAGEGWRKVSVEFRGQPHGNPMNVRFVVIGEGKGYFDDFRVFRVTDEP